MPSMVWNVRCTCHSAQFWSRYWAQNDVIANLLIDVPPFTSKLTWFLGGYCFLIESTVSGYSFLIMSLRVLVDGITSSRHNAVYDVRSSMFDLRLLGISGETNPNIMLRSLLSWWNSAVRKSFAACLEYFVSQLNQYRWDLTVEYSLPFRTYYCNSWTVLSHQNA